MAKYCKTEWWILNTCLVPIVILHLSSCTSRWLFLKNSLFTFYFVRHFLQKYSEFFYISWRKMSDRINFRLLWRRKDFEWAITTLNSESTNEFQTNNNNNNNNNNKSLKRIPVSIVASKENGIEDFAKKQKALNMDRGTNTEVRRLMTWHIQRYGKLLNLSTVTKQTANFFLEIWDTRKGKETKDYKPGTLTTYRNGVKMYFLKRPEFEGEFFDIGEDEDLKKKPSSKRKQLKSVGKRNRPNACDPLNDEQVAKLWSIGAIGLKTPQQLINLVW